MNKIEKIQPSHIFTNYVFKAIPLAFDESMSYYEMLCGILDMLKTQEEVINNNADLLAQLESYVENYFENLDVQEEINNKLDEMAEDGTLENLIGQYIQLATTYVYNNVNEMKEATNLVNGSFAHTTGFYNNNDGGGAYYKIRTITNEDTIDNIHLFALTNSDTLVAELNEYNKINILQLGAKTTEDVTVIINYALENFNDIVIPEGLFNVSNSLILKDNNYLHGINFNSIIFIINSSKGSGYLCPIF